MASEEQNIHVNLVPLFGHVEIESRMRPEGNKVIGEGRSLYYDGDGKLTKDTGWRPTGIVLTWPEVQRRPWWRFWN